MKIKRGLRAAAVAMTAALALAACGDPALNRDAWHAADGIDDLPDVKPVDIRKLIWPSKNYLGLAYDGTIDNGLTHRAAFDQEVGADHNLLKYFEQFGATFKTDENKKIWDAGALPFADVEPYQGTLKDFIDGKYDWEIKSYALQLKASNIPIAYSWGHEFNGWWYPWGYCSKNGEFNADGSEKTGDDIGEACTGNDGRSKDNTPEQFAEAWRHIHDIFTNLGVGNVIWVWSPNTARGDAKRPLPPLKDYYPGDEYVDWIGISGYMNGEGNKETKNGQPHIFRDVWGKTVNELRQFSQKPIMIAETGSTATVRKANDITHLLQGVKREDDFLGFVWFNIKKEEFGNISDFRVDARPDSTQRYRTLLSPNKMGAYFGFDPKQLIDEH